MEESKLNNLNFNGLGHSQELLYTLNSLRASQEFCDVTLQVGNTSAMAHRVILSASSPYFRAMFTSGLAETTKDVIVMQDINEKAFFTIIDYFYTSKIDINEGNVQDILTIAGLLQVPKISMACCEFLKRQMSAENCLGIASFADAHACSNLAHTAASYARNHFIDIVQQDEFMLISVSHLLRIISDDGLNVHTEERVFESVLSWINYDYETRKEYAAELFSHVRFPLMSPEFVIDRVAKEAVMRSSSQCIDLLMETMSMFVLSRERTPPQQVTMSPRKNVSAQCCLYAVGGMGRRTAVKSGERFDPREGKWKPIANMNVCRWSAAMASIGPYLYICGGSDDKSRVNTVERYDPFNNVWITLNPMTTNRNGVGLAACSGKIFAVGGFDGSSILNTAEVYDPKVGKWNDLPSMKYGRFGVGCCVLNDQIYAVGGSNGSNLKTVERYDPVANTWTLVAPLNTARKQVGCVAFGGFIYAIGGICDNTVGYLKSVERYDPNFDSWLEISPMTSPRGGCGVAELDGFIFVVGGHDGTNYLNTVERYDPLTNHWHTSSPMGQARDCVAVCVATTKRVKRLADSSRSPSPPVSRTLSNSNTASSNPQSTSVL